jgi:hypothetical protein
LVSEYKPFKRSWYIAAHVWKIYDFKIEVVPLIINFSTELTTVVTTISLEMPVPSQDHYGFHSFPVVD